MNILPTTPIGGASPSRMPAAPDQAPAREAATTVLATLLSTPATNAAGSGGQGSDLQSVMGSLVENGLQESLSADETELPLFSQLTDKAGQVLSPEKKAQLANELATVMMRQLTAAAATPAASPTKPMTGPMQNFQQALAVSVAQASSGINFSVKQPDATSIKRSTCIGKPSEARSRPGLHKIYCSCVSAHEGRSRPRIAHGGHEGTSVSRSQYERGTSANTSTAAMSTALYCR